MRGWLGWLGAGARVRERGAADGGAVGVHPDSERGDHAAGGRGPGDHARDDGDAGADAACAAGDGGVAGVEPGVGAGVLGGGAGRAADGGTLWAMGAAEPERPGPGGPLLCALWVDHRAGGADAADCADVHRVSGGRGEDEPGALPHLYVCGVVAVVLRAGVCGDAAGSELGTAIRSSRRSFTASTWAWRGCWRWDWCGSWCRTGGGGFARRRRERRRWTRSRGGGIY